MKGKLDEEISQIDLGVIDEARKEFPLDKLTIWEWGWTLPDDNHDEFWTLFYAWFVKWFGDGQP